MSWLRFIARTFAGLLLLLPLVCLAQVQQLAQAGGLVSIGGASTPLTVALPYHWDKEHRGLSGTAQFDVRFQLEAEDGEQYGMYFRRIGNAYEVWLNGALLERKGDLRTFDAQDFAKVPRYIPVPARLLRGDNVLTLRIRADGGRRGGVAAPVVGPADEVRPLFHWEYGWRVVGSFAVVVLSLLIGLGGIMLWLTQVDVSAPAGEGRDNLYLFAGIAELAWALRVGDALIEQPPIPWGWWGTLQTAALAAWLACMTLFCLKLAGWDGGPRGTLLKRVLAALFLLGCAAAYISLEMDRRWVLSAWYSAAGAFYSAFGIVFMLAAWRSANLEHRLAAVALAVNTVVGIRDVVVFRFASSFGDNTLMRYSSLLFGILLAYVLITRFSAATSQARDLMRDLERKVSEREKQLRASYAELEELAREQERTSERARILRDMHDGVGSHITSAIRQLQSGKADARDILETLRESLDHLKLSIDAMSLPAGDVTALLANFRYRLEPRLAASNIRLEWAVDVLEPLAHLDAADMRHLQFIVFEAVSNVLQHARASTIRIEASRREDVTRLRLIDDGKGFDAKLPSRSGLRSMHDRARAVGAQLVVESSEHGTTIELVLDSAAGRRGAPGPATDLPGPATIQPVRRELPPEAAEGAS